MVVLAGMVLGATLLTGSGGADAGATAATSGAGEVVYSNLPADLHGLPVAVFESYAIGEFGGEVRLGGTSRRNPVVTVMLAELRLPARPGGHLPHQSGSRLQLAAHARALSGRAP